MEEKEMKEYKVITALFLSAVMLGTAPYYKCNMTDIMASLGLVQLRRYPNLLKRRREIIEKYNEANPTMADGTENIPDIVTDSALSGESSERDYELSIETGTDVELTESDFYDPEFRVEKYVKVRNSGKKEECSKIIEKMAEKGVATNVHYKPLPLLTAYKNLGFDIKDYPNAYHMFENEITLPLHTKLSDEDVDYIIKSFKECL